ncbi:auxin-responsive protein SAUR64-like [Dioscorea cayenensis subsp. rotundata]|uniref:Auxin-responsive protein SAUR64-like n=1 Tax=Dioscorea cayennensis subsp. rotundata TaxID=55577 RepID=A0AB40BLR6_DIOCR|nr:auxin-responsive protein SAUR64-like [Dioscorea cayenensis subsp. rotundata]
MARKWQISAALGKRRISSDSDACTSSSSVADKGHFIVYTLEGKRFMVPLSYLESSVFKELFRMSEEEFGLPSDGPITLPCDSVFMEYLLSLLRRRVSKDVEKALFQSACSLGSVGHSQHVAVCSF